jgi:hypothetical protein
MNTINKFTAPLLMQIHEVPLDNFKHDFLELARQLVSFTPDEITLLSKADTKLIPFIDTVLAKLLEHKINLTPTLAGLVTLIKMHSYSEPANQQLAAKIKSNGTLANLIGELQSLASTAALFNYSLGNTQVARIPNISQEQPYFPLPTINLQPPSPSANMDKIINVCKATLRLNQHLEFIDECLSTYAHQVNHQGKKDNQMTSVLNTKLLSLKGAIEIIRNRYIAVKQPNEFHRLDQDSLLVERKLEQIKEILATRAGFTKLRPKPHQLQIEKKANPNLNLIYARPNNLPKKLKNYFFQVVAQYLVDQSTTNESALSTNLPIANCFALYTLLENRKCEKILDQKLRDAINWYQQLPEGTVTPSNFVQGIPRKLLIANSHIILAQVKRMLNAMGANLATIPNSILNNFKSATNHPKLASIKEYIFQAGLHEKGSKLNYQQIADNYNKRIIENYEFSLPLVSRKFIRQFARNFPSIKK